MVVTIMDSHFMVDHKPDAFSVSCTSERCPSPSLTIPEQGRQALDPPQQSGHCFGI